MDGEGSGDNVADANDVIVADKNDGNKIIPPTQAVPYRAVTEEDIGKTKLKFYKKKADALEPEEDPPTPVDPAIVTAANMAEYVVEDAPAAPAMGAALPSNGPKSDAAIDPALVEQGVQMTRAILNEVDKDKLNIGGRRRSKRRHPKKGSRKSKKGGARKSKKVGRSRKNGSKRRAHRKH